METAVRARCLRGSPGDQFGFSELALIFWMLWLLRDPVPISCRVTLTPDGTLPLRSQDTPGPQEAAATSLPQISPRHHGFN